MFWSRAVTPAVVLTLILSRAAIAQPDDDPDRLAPGLLARYGIAGAARSVAHRVVVDPRWRWDDTTPDPRIPHGKFEVHAEGLLLIQAPGSYRFHVEPRVGVTLLLGDRIVPSSGGETTLELPAGFTPFLLDFQSSPGVTGLSIDWSGPGFTREPLPARLLFHDPRREVLDSFEEGRRLADRLGCANCHQGLGLTRHPSLGPPLNGVGSTVRPDWLVRSLRDPAAESPSSRMPTYGKGLAEQDAADLVAFLNASAPAPSVSAELRMALNVASPEQGRLLFETRGCLACHTRGEPTEKSRLDGTTDLARLGQKRNRIQTAALLEHPRSGKALSRHRPDPGLTADDAAQLAAFLVEVEPPDRVEDRPVPPADRNRGKRLAQQFRCAACHVVKGLEPPAADLPLSARSRVDQGCLSDLPPNSSTPHFTLDRSQRDQLRAFLRGIPTNPAPLDPLTQARDILARRNCLGCHVRDGEGANLYQAQLTARIAASPVLASFKGRLTPPNLTAVGDKLREPYLVEAVRGQSPVARPWLSVRMPRHEFEPGEAERIVAAFRIHDRMAVASPDEAQASLAASHEVIERGTTLIGQRGFGCTSCHVIAGRIPPGGEPETLGPDLALAHRRLTERYFRRWLSDPQRILAGTPMPQFLKPVVGDRLPLSLDDQLGAVWRLLGDPKLAEVTATGTREVLQRVGDRALVVRDMFLLPNAPETPYTPRGLAIGLANDMSLLFDADRLTWLAWWQGGFAYRTKSGRLWEWHPDGRPLWTAATRMAPLAWLHPDGSIEMPEEIRERFGSFRELVFEGKGVRLHYRLERHRATPVEVTETIQPTENGWDRSVRIAGPANGARPLLIEQVPANALTERGTSALAWRTENARVSFVIDGGELVPNALPPWKNVRAWALQPGASGEWLIHQRVRIEKSR
ncbi:MAG: c-type cytochrome [Isosphaeraceae bacterium]